MHALKKGLNTKMPFGIRKLYVTVRETPEDDNEDGATLVHVTFASYDTPT